MKTPLPNELRPHVLLVEDDNPAVPDFLIRVLSAAGFRVTLTSHVVDMPDRVSLVVLDTGPFGAGLRTLLGAVRSRWSRVPVLVLLASAEVDAWQAIAEDGLARAMEKPFTPSVLTHTARELLATPTRSESAR